jgi:hypothetical protein
MLDVAEKLTGVARHTRDAEQLLYAMKIAASFDSIASVDDGSDRYIRFDELEANNSIMLVSWNAKKAASSFFATLVHQALIAHGDLCTTLGRPKVMRPMLFDEFSALFGIDYAQSLTQQRQHGFSHHLLLQSVSQLTMADKAMAAVALAQCQLKLFLSMDFETQEYIQTHSKMHAVSLSGKTMSERGLALSERDILDRMLTINTLLDVGGQFGAGVLVREIQKGHNEPFLLYLEHEISRAAFDHWNGLALPLKPEPPKPEPKVIAQNPAWQARASEIKKLFLERRAKESIVS